MCWNVHFNRLLHKYVVFPSYYVWWDNLYELPDLPSDVTCHKASLILVYRTCAPWLWLHRPKDGFSLIFFFVVVFPGSCRRKWSWTRTANTCTSASLIALLIQVRWVFLCYNFSVWWPRVTLVISLMNFSYGFLPILWNHLTITICAIFSMNSSSASIFYSSQTCWKKHSWNALEDL